MTIEPITFSNPPTQKRFAEPIHEADGVKIFGCPHAYVREVWGKSGIASDTPETYFLALSKTETLALCTVCHQAITGSIMSRFLVAFDKLVEASR